MGFDFTVQSYHPNPNNKKRLSVCVSGPLTKLRTPLTDFDKKNWKVSYSNVSPLYLRTPWPMTNFTEDAKNTGEIDFTKKSISRKIDFADLWISRKTQFREKIDTAEKVPKLKNQKYNILSKFQTFWLRLEFVNFGLLTVFTWSAVDFDHFYLLTSGDWNSWFCK